MKKIMNLFAGLLMTCSGFAQTTDTLICDAPDRDTIEAELLPWFGNNAYLENFLDSIGYGYQVSRIVGPDRVRYHVPIKFWIYRSSAGVGGPTVQQLQAYIDNLNRFYNIDNDTRIGFYMKCNFTFIDDDDHLAVSDAEARGLIQSHKEPGCINVHITNVLSDNANGVHYRARFFGVDGIFLSRNTYTDAALVSTFSHEVGHYFELDHTHQYSGRGKCRKEAIDRNRTWPFIMFCPFGGGGPSSQKICEATGDFLRDTPADHELNGNASCNYVLTGNTDPWGDHYETPPAGSLPPDTRNIMSYNGWRDCRVRFSRLQIAVMLHSIERGKSKNNRNAWKDSRAEYDDYEMDNFSATARNILFNEVQERNFHQQYEETLPVWSQCDVDWVRFTAPCSGTFEVVTFAMAGRTNANTRLTLFDNNLNQLAQNDDISPADRFSSILFSFAAGNTYFIRVENMSNLVTGYYNLQVGRFSISGNAILCTPSTYTVQNLPAGATVTWSANPSGMVSFNPAGPTTSPSTTVTKVFDGNTVITATINFCGNQYTATLPVTVGAALTGYYVISSNYHQPIQRPLYTNNSAVWLPANQSFGITAYITNSNPISPAWARAAGSYPFNWSSSGVQLNFMGSAGSSAYSQRNGVFNFTANTGCGTTTTTFTWPIIVQGWGFRIMATPNPARDNLSVSIVDESAEVKAVGKNENLSMKLFGLGSSVIIKQWTFKNSQSKFSLNISGIKSGQYVLHVQKGKFKQSELIVIE